MASVAMWCKRFEEVDHFNYLASILNKVVVSTREIITSNSQATAALAIMYG